MARSEGRKVTARLADTGRLVHAANDRDWALVRGPDKPALYCPERPAGCTGQVHPVQRINKSNGTISRFFRFNPGSPIKCGHAEADPVILPTGGGGRETREHKWLKEYVRDIAIELGHQAHTEKTLHSGVIADVWVPTATQCPRVEIQRVKTDIPTRTKQDPNVVWLLRSVHGKAMTNFLFHKPCVRVLAGDSNAIPDRPWDEPDREFTLRAGATVLRPAAAPEWPRGYFETHPIELRLFLQQVWAGDRIWIDNPQVHKFGSWILTTDLEQHNQWRAEEKARRNAPRLSETRPQPLQPEVTHDDVAVDDNDETDQNDVGLSSDNLTQIPFIHATPAAKPPEHITEPLNIHPLPLDEAVKRPIHQPNSPNDRPRNRWQRLTKWLTRQ